MEIVPDSFLEFASSRISHLHIRYLGKEGDSGDGAGDAGEAQLTTDERHGNHKKVSLVVIRQPYSFLASAIRSMFEGDEDVEVIVDRRKVDRRRESVPVVVERRIEKRDRRESFPILDVVIDLDA